MKRVVKIALITLATIIVLVLAAAVAIPYFFKDQILVTIKETANESLNAKMDFSDVSLSLFRNFPNLTVRLYDLTIDNIEPFEGIRLADVKSADITVDIMSVIRNENPLKIKAINVVQPKINVYVLEDGRANYDIAKPSADTVVTTEEPADLSAFRANLQRYSIENGEILYDDESLGAYVLAKGLNHSGSGDFTIDVYDLDTDTEIDSLTVRYGGITYLKRAHTILAAIFNIDQRNSKYTLKDNLLKVNELELNADGFVQLLDTSNIAMELTFSTPQSDFKNLLSMIPNAYIAGYENVKADGKFNLGGFVKGTYNGELEQYPAFQVNVGVENGNVKYPDLPLGISNINTKVNINSPTSNFDDMVVNVPTFAMKLGSNPIKAIFNLKTPISDPDIDTKIDGVLNLKELSQAFPMDGMDMNGVIAANIEAQTRLSYIENQQYERVKMDGVAEITNLNYKDATYPAIRINNAKAAFTPQNVRVDNFDAKLGKSDIKANGRVDNILAYFSPKKTMRGSFTVRSNYFDANEWVPQEEVNGPALPASEDKQPAEQVEIFDRFDFTLDATVGEIVYDSYNLKNTVVKGNMKPNKLVAQELSTQIGDSDIRASGTITNMFDYLFDNQTLGGNINLASNYLNLNQFMPEDGTDPVAQPVATSTDASTAGGDKLDPILVPKNIDIDINADIKKLLYTNLELNNITGKLVVANQAVMLEDVTANALGGKMALSGGYDTKDTENPAFSIKYDLQSMDFQKSFNAFNSFQVLAPIGQFLKGTFNTSLILDGKLNENMMPDFTTLNAKGFLETLNAVIDNFKPLQAIGNKLNLDYFKEDLSITNTKNWFELKNGMVEVKEFDYKYKDIDMKIAGTHSLTQEINYIIKAKIPRKLLEKTGVGAAASAGYDQLAKEASKFGLNLKQSEFVNVQFNLTGSIKDPKVGMNLLGADGEAVAGSPAEAAKDAVKEEAERKIAEGKEKVQETAKEAIDSVKTVLVQKAEAAKDSLANKAKEALKDKVGSVIDTSAVKEVDKIKEELDKFNPFKKKKKNNEEGGNNGN